MSEIHGNEFVINISQSQYDEFGSYWLELASRRARIMQRETVVIVDGRVVYRAGVSRTEQGEGGEG